MGFDIVLCVELWDDIFDFFLVVMFMDFIIFIFKLED